MNPFIHFFQNPNFILKHYTIVIYKRFVLIFANQEQDTGQLYNTWYTKFI